jgi:hypothetical protein
MPVNTTSQGNISISAINAENSATTSNSLKTLSETAIEAGNVSTLNECLSSLVILIPPLTTLLGQIP